MFSTSDLSAVERTLYQEYRRRLERIDIGQRELAEAKTKVRELNDGLQQDNKVSAELRKHAKDNGIDLVAIHGQVMSQYTHMTLPAR